MNCSKFRKTIFSRNEFLQTFNFYRFFGEFFLTILSKKREIESDPFNSSVARDLIELDTKIDR